MESLSSLVELDISNCISLVVLPNMDSLSSLIKLDISNCISLAKLPNMESLSSLVELDISNCISLVVHPNMEGLSSLVKLDISNCKSLVVLPNMESLSSLVKLDISHCTSLVELPNMESLSSLVELDISNCNALSIPDNYLHEDLPIAPRSLSSSLKEIDLMGRYYLQSLPLSLCHHSNLKILCLDDLQNLRSLPHLPPNLEILSAKNCISLEKIENLSNLKRLYRLDIQNCKSLVELSDLQSLEYLNCLGIANCIGLRIPSIEKWFKARSKGDRVEIWFHVGMGSVVCCFPIPLGNEKFEILHSVIDPCSEIDDCNGIRFSARIKSSGAWTIKEHKYINIEPKFSLIIFEVPTVMGEVLEVCAELQAHVNIIFCLFEIHRNREGEVRFFPSTRGSIPA
ncbi:PREDICTED: disease resistance protein TAO1-like [Ipomoea nil]|uniref:disease resistance protein TAO1-like n=1 Tax=Ipomoea nil TaxID=35883 RepID=UPI000901DA85|nr:PREDICTED: disease resistance protein TAO1-like [Ipomoea nil]